MEKKFTEDNINRFLNGHDEFEHITNIECSYDDEVSIIYNKDKRKLVIKEPFFPFVWVKNSVCIRMFDGMSTVIKKKHIQKYLFMFTKYKFWIFIIK